MGGSKDTDSPILFRPNSLPEDPAAGVLVAHDGAGALLEFDAADGKFFRWVEQQATEVSSSNLYTSCTTRRLSMSDMSDGGQTTTG